MELNGKKLKYVVHSITESLGPEELRKPGQSWRDLDLDPSDEELDQAFGDYMQRQEMIV